MKKLLCIIFLLSNLAHADTSVLNQGVSQAISVTNAPPSAVTPISKAAEAGLMQLGWTKDTNDFTNQATTYAQKNAEKFIDEYFPINHQQLYFILGSAYTLGYQKSINNVTFQDPLFKSMTHTLSISQQGANLGIKLSF